MVFVNAVDDPIVPPALLKIVRNAAGKYLYLLTVPCKKMAFWSIYLINLVFLTKVFEL